MSKIERWTAMWVLIMVGMGIGVLSYNWGYEKGITETLKRIVSAQQNLDKRLKALEATTKEK
jgi:hypothetical protein